MKILNRAFNFGIKFLQMQYTLKIVADLLARNYIKLQMDRDPKYNSKKCLAKFAHQCYSQNGEDGIITEIFSRIGTTNNFFVEFGVGNGLENNTTNLLIKNWSGLWMEGNSESINQINLKFGHLIRKKQLSVKKVFITPENIEKLFLESKVPEEFDLLSIDIDGNDYWVWKAIGDFRPRVIVIEYNGFVDPRIKWVMKYNPHHVWNGKTNFVGASLKSLEILGREKGYRLVGCNIQGSNAFFVRGDLIKNRFLSPFTAENHYEPSRDCLVQESGGMRDFGEFESI